MAGRYIFDIETDGLLKDLTKVHCMGIYDIDSGEQFSCNHTDGVAIEAGLAVLRQASLIVGHNIIGFDLPALEKVYGFKPKGVIRDTFVLTRLMWPHIADYDFEAARKNAFPKNLIGAHSLEAWGRRLGEFKGDYKGGWEKWSPEMQAYMDQDVIVTTKLWQRIEKEASAWGVPLEQDDPEPGKDCVALEHRVAQIVEQVQRHGFRFDSTRASALCAKLTARKQALVQELVAVFPPRTVEEIFVPKVNNKTRGYVKGEPFIKKHIVEFNPGSRQEVAFRLKQLGWEPKAFTKEGDAKVDDEILRDLPYPQAKLLAEYYMVEKRLGQIANGKESWFRHQRDGRIHGRIHSGGAHTGRMTHSNPNLAQVPGNHAPYGEECRDCFVADEGFVLVGCDADALELRDLAGYMAAWDEGAYVETVLHGDKSSATDMHSINAKAIGCSRDDAKVFFYAMIYGAGDAKLAETLGQKSPAYGKQAREKLMKGVPALGGLIQGVQSRIAEVGFLRGLDGRRLRTRSKNAALNTLLQSAGAVQMKRGLVLLVDALTAKGWEFGREYAIVGLIHDEWQANVLPELAAQYGVTAVQSIRDAGTFYSFKCPLDGQSKVGLSWKDTH